MAPSLAVLYIQHCSGIPLSVGIASLTV